MIVPWRERHLFWWSAGRMDLRVSCGDFERFLRVDLISVVGVSLFLLFSRVLCT